MVVHVWVGGPQDDLDEAGLVGRARVVVVDGLLGGLGRRDSEGKDCHRHREEDEEEGDLDFCCIMVFIYALYLIA